MAAVLKEFAEAGLVNVVGGCCGTTPAHIAAMKTAVRRSACGTQSFPSLRLSGLEPFTFDESSSSPTSVSARTLRVRGASRGSSRTIAMRKHCPWHVNRC